MAVVDPTNKFVCLDDVECHPNGHKWTQGFCDNCNRCQKEECCGIITVYCCWEWVGGLPLKKPI